MPNPNQTLALSAELAELASYLFLTSGAIQGKEIPPGPAVNAAGNRVLALAKKFEAQEKRAGGVDDGLRALDFPSSTTPTPSEVCDLWASRLGAPGRLLAESEIVERDLHKFNSEATGELFVANWTPGAIELQIGGTWKWYLPAPTGWRRLLSRWFPRIARSRADWDRIRLYEAKFGKPMAESAEGF